MPSNTIKDYIDNNLPSNNEIAMSILRGVLKAMIDDYYSELPSGLSMTQQERDKLAGIEALAQVNELSHDISFINGLQTILDDKATTIYVDNSISNLINGAPVNLDTLGELAAAINNDANFYNNIISTINGITNNINSNDRITPYQKLTINKSSAGTDDNILEAGDRCTGWLTPTIFLTAGIYVAGDPNLVASYEVNTIDYTDYS